LIDHPEREPEFVQDMVVAGETIQRYAKGGKQAFLASEMARDAIIRQFLVMGEAARRLSEATRTANPQVPWRSIMTLRNRLVHGYDEIEVDRLWDIIGTSLKEALPELRRLKERL